jgi:hypothetical protein
MPKAKTPLKERNEPPARTHKLDSSNPKLKYIGGSNFDAWNNTIANQANSSIWHGHNPNAERIHERQVASLSLLAGISPNDEFEGMLAAQILASHNAAMECYRRAMIAEQTLEGRKENLSQANKLSRTHATLLEVLNRHRGKGQQRVTVEHVHVHEGGQAIVGNVAGGGVRTKSENHPHALGYGTRSGKPCQSPAMANGRCRMHGGPSPGAPKGNRNAFKHGRYSAEAICRRREISALIRRVRAFLSDSL